MSTTHFVYRLIPPRPSFAGDMTESEMAVMGAHAEYWTELFERGVVVAFGVVLDPTASWGLSLVEAASEDEVRDIAAHDPAVTSGLCTFEIGVMPNPSVRPAAA